MEWIGSIKVGKENSVVYGPAFAIFGSSTERQFFLSLKKKEVANGFVNRHLLFNAGRGAEKSVKPRYELLQIPRWLARALAEVSGPPAPVDNTRKVLGKTVVWDFRRIGWGDGAEEVWARFEDEIRGLPSVEERELWIRAPEIALRLATVLAVFRGSGVVEVTDLEWSIKLARLSTSAIAKGVSEHMLEEYEQADLVDHVRQEFRRMGELRWGQIRKLCERITGDYRKIDAAIHHLVTCEEIEELENPNEPPGPAGQHGGGDGWEGEFASPEAPPA
jgi:hypothetical protein